MKTFMLFLCFSTSMVFGHKSYISIATMEYNEKLGQIEVSLKLTAHDFEHVLAKKFNEKIHIENVNDTSKIGLFIQTYLAENFTIKSLGKLVPMQYVGKEVTLRDDLYFYFTFKPVLNPSHIIIQNSILFELFSKQQNRVHYQYHDIIKSGTITPQSTVLTIKN